MPRLRDEFGLGALVVTHDLGLAWSIADRITVTLPILSTGGGTEVACHYAEATAPADASGR